MSEKLLKNYIYHTAYQVLLLLAPLVTTPYVARVLGAEGVGIYAYAQSIAAYFVLLAAVGTTLYGQREIAYAQNDRQGRSRVFWSVTLFRFGAAAVCTAVYALLFAREGAYAPVHRILTLEVAATALDISWFFIGMENFRLVVLRNAAVKLAGILLTFLLVTKPGDVTRYTLCLTVPAALGNLSLWPGLRGQITAPSKGAVHAIRHHLLPILALFLPQAATEVYTVLDKTMLGLLCPDIQQVGYYTQAQKIIKLLLCLITSLGAVMLPAMSAAVARGERIEGRVRTALRFVSLLAFGALFGLLGTADRFVPLFFGRGYEPVTTLMAVISPILLLIGWSNVLGKQYLLPQRRQRAFTASILTGAGVNFVLNLALIPPFGAMGACAATVAAEGAVTAVQLFCVRSQLMLRGCLGFCGRYLLLGAALLGMLRIVSAAVPPDWKGLAGMGAAGAAVWCAGLYWMKDPLLAAGVKWLKSKHEGRKSDV